MNWWQSLKEKIKAWRCRHGCHHLTEIGIHNHYGCWVDQCDWCNKRVMVPWLPVYQKSWVIKPDDPQYDNYWPKEEW